MKVFLAVILVICGVLEQDVVSGSIGSWACIAGVTARYTFSRDGRCSLNQMQSSYNAMKQANCRNCDKYFHCKGNYNAVYRCQRSSTNRRVAVAISNCREQGQNSADSRADQVANRYGRNGGNCESRYLCSYGCYYDPRSRRCSRSVCN